MSGHAQKFPTVERLIEARTEPSGLQKEDQRGRARVATNNPLFPNTAWFSVQGSGITEAKLRKTWR